MPPAVLTGQTRYLQAYGSYNDWLTRLPVLAPYDCTGRHGPWGPTDG